MSIRNYTFNYNAYEAEACFKVDTEKFDVEMAKATLDFFTWDYDKEADPIDEVMKKYALEAIRIATFNNYSLYGVKEEFMNNEGFAKVDGSMGIELNVVQGYEFDVEALSMEVVAD